MNHPQKKSSSSVALAVNKATKSYGDVVVLKNIDLTMQEGEFLVLLGPSGCGKTTLLRLIAGLTPVDSGRITLQGHDVTNMPAHKRDIGLVFQNYALFPHMTVFKNVAFGLRMRGLDKQAIRQRVHDTLQILHMEGLEKRKPKELSGGQQQRVALARALALQPYLLLLDEPLSNLDAKLRAAVRVEIVQLQRQLGVPAILVTHDQVEAMTMGDRIVLMYEGVVQQAGTPLEIYHNPANRFVAEFVGSPAINLFSMALDGGEVRLGRSTTTHPAALLNDCLRDAMLNGRAGRNYLLGVRPEDVDVSLEGNPEHLQLLAHVMFIERLGSDTFLHLQMPDDDSKPVIARGPRRLGKVEVGQNVYLTFRPNSAHVFDAESGSRVTAPA
jgi:multiple sugar transport system ATP-binding protein